jgi:hypothetical protein
VSSVKLGVTYTSDRKAIVKALSTIPYLRILDKGTVMRYSIAESNERIKYTIELSNVIRVVAECSDYNLLRQTRIKSLIYALSIASFLSDYIKIDVSSAYSEILDLMLPEIMRTNQIPTDNKDTVLQEVSKSNFILSQKLVEAVSLFEAAEQKASMLHSATIKLYGWLQKNVGQTGQNAPADINAAGLSDEELELVLGGYKNEQR